MYRSWFLTTSQDTRYALILYETSVFHTNGGHIFFN